MAADFYSLLGKRGFSPWRKEIILIGSGGSARALLVSLIRAGSGRVTIINRTFKKGKALARRYQALGKTQVRSLPLERLTDPKLLSTASLIVNCTPVGLHEKVFLPLAYSATPSTCLFYDLLYRPVPTPFLSQARSAQRQTLDGRRMLLHQGALAFSLWTRTMAPLDTMERALSRSLKGRATRRRVSQPTEVSGS